jgi:hypothetical protein
MLASLLNSLKKPAESVASPERSVNGVKQK